MGANLILPFAQGGGATVLTQADYTADGHRTIGNQPGVARAPLVNKALRQLSALCAGVAQFIADNQVSDVTDDLLAAALSTMIGNAVRTAAQNPAGAIVWVPGTMLLTQTLKLNGAAVLRATYSRLWTYAQVSGNLAASDGAWVSGQFSPGDGSTTFRLPDLRGYSLRAWDDGRGIDAGRLIGTVQADQLLAHTHAITDPGHNHTATVTDPGHTHAIAKDLIGAQDLPTLTDSAGTDESPTGNLTGSSTTGITVTVNGNTSGITINASSGGTEVRVKNLALMPVIFY